MKSRQRSTAKKFPTPETRMILSPKELGILLNYERIRPDRFGCVFSIISLKSNVEDSVVFNIFITGVLESIRIVDRIAWDNQGNVMILFQDTNNTRAESFCEKCNKILADDQFFVKKEIYTYPDQWDSNYQKGFLNNENNQRSKIIIETIFTKKIPVWKRVMDISLSLLLIVIFSPLLVFIAAYIKIVSPGPNLFTQNRIGYKGLPFKFYKFRSMKHGKDQTFHGKHSQCFIKDGDVPMKKLDSNDPRIIPGGKFLRNTSIDELPQLWNVLKGDMSLVGPRPCIPYEAVEYLRWQTHRFDIVPGLTGLWQVSGKNNLTFKQMIRLDITYAKKMSLAKDLLILIKTPITVLQLALESFFSKKETEKDEETSLLEPDGEL